MKLRDLLTRSIISFVDIFADRRKLPRIEMELILDNHNNIAFSPATGEVSEMILSVVSEVRWGDATVSRYQSSISTPLDL